MEYKAIVVGCSAGGFNALESVLSHLERDFPLPIVVVQHMSPEFKNNFAKLLDSRTNMKVKEAQEKEHLEGGIVYMAPRDYHLLIEDDETFSLSAEPHINFSRPSIDPLFESAADVYGDGLVAVILTGANNDGSEGLRRVRSFGGLSIVQDPAQAHAFEMPKAAIERAGADHVLSLEKISEKLKEIVKGI